MEVIGMDQKTKDKMLKYLLTDPTYVEPYNNQLVKQFSNISTDVIDLTLQELAKEGYVTLSRSNDGYLFADATPAAIGYFREKNEQTKIKWEHHAWDLFKIGIGFLLGCLVHWLFPNK
jgi:hypothetical protein